MFQVRENDPSYKPPDTSRTSLHGPRIQGSSAPHSTWGSYQNNPQYLQNIDLNFGASANPVTADFNGRLFGSIGAGALGGTVLIPAAGTAYGAASSLTLDLSIKAYAAGGAALGAAWNAGANLYYEASNFYLQNAAQFNAFSSGVIGGGPGVSTIDNSLILNNWENVGILGRSAVDFFRGGQ